MIMLNIVTNASIHSHNVTIVTVMTNLYVAQYQGLLQLQAWVSIKPRLINSFFLH